MVTFDLVKDTIISVLSHRGDFCHVKYTKKYIYCHIDVSKRKKILSLVFCLTELILFMLNIQKNVFIVTLM